MGDAGAQVEPQRLQALDPVGDTLQQIGADGEGLVEQLALPALRLAGRAVGVTDVGQAVLRRQYRADLLEVGAEQFGELADPAQPFDGGVVVPAFSALAVLAGVETPAAAAASPIRSGRLMR